jgi:predicted dehydrogenase
MVEKPLAATLAEADELLALAEQHKRILQPGHLERFNPAVLAIEPKLTRPMFFESHRLSIFTPRSLDVDVVLDLMIHDLDLALALSPSDPAMVEADGARVANDTLDRVDAEVEFDDGFVARFRASRVAEARERTMRIVYPSGEVRVDFLTHAFENTTPFALDPNFEEAPAARDKLGASLAAFLAAVRGEGAPLASAGDGARSLDLALAIEQAMVQQGLV